MFSPIGKIEEKVCMVLMRKQEKNCDIFFCEILNLKN